MRALGTGILIALGLVLASTSLSAQATHSLVYSTSPDRSNPQPLAGATLSGDVCIFIAPQSGVKKVVFYLDTPVGGTAFRTEGAGPWDFNGTGPAPAQLAIPFPTSTIANGAHTVTAVVTRTAGGNLTLSSDFTVSNSAILFLPNALSLTVEAGQSATSNVVLQATDGSATPFSTSVAAGASWLSITASGTSTPATIAVDVNTAGLALGSHTATVTAQSATLGSAMLTVTLLVVDTSVTYDLLIAPAPDRVGAVPFASGSVVAGDIHVYTSPDTGVQRVRFHFDDPAGTGTPYRIETSGPFDLNGTGAGNTCLPFSTATLWDGAHTLTAVVERVGLGPVTITRNFTVANLPSSLSFGEPTAALVLDQGMTQTFSRTLSTTNGLSATFQLASSASWLTATCTGCSPSGVGTTVAQVGITASTAGLASGVHTGTITATATSGTQTAATLQVTLTVIGSGVSTLVASAAPNRSGAIPLEGATLSGATHIFLTPESGVTRVDFWIDNPTRSGPPFRSETGAPFDLNGGTAAAAIPFDTNTLPDGLHTLTAAVTFQTGTLIVIHSGFLVANGPAALAFSPATLNIALESGASALQPISLLATVGSLPAATLSTNASWLSAAFATGGAPGSVELGVDTAGLAAGSYVGNVTASASGFLAGVLPVTLVVFANGNYDLLVSSSPNRSNAVDLSNKNVTGNIYVFVGPETGIASVRFYVDDPTASGVIHRTENNAPFDLNGGSAAAATPFSTAGMTDGLHSITAVITLAAGGSETVVAPFTVANGSPGLLFGPQEFDIVIDEEGIAVSNFVVGTTNDSTTVYTLTEGAAWLTVLPNTASTGSTTQLTLDVSTLSPGTHTSVVTATAPGYFPAQLVVSVSIAAEFVFELDVSTSPSLASPSDLSGSVLAGDAYVFVSPSTWISSVAFYIDDPDRSGAPYQVDTTAPYLLSGGSGPALPFDTTTLGDGPHQLTAVVNVAGGGQGIIGASFWVQNGLPSLVLGSATASVTVDEGMSAQTTMSLSTSNLAAASYAIAESASWLTVTPSTGSTPTTLTFSIDSTGLGAGFYTAVVQANAPGFEPATTTVGLTVQGESIYDLWLSATPDRSAPTLLDGAQVAGPIYVFTGPDTLVDRVRFFIDNPTASGNPYRTENSAPYDLAGGNATTANAFQTSSISDGSHTLTALIDLDNGVTEAITSSFVVLNNGPALLAVPSGFNFMYIPGGDLPLPQTLSVSTSLGESVAYSIVSTAGWLTVTSTAGTTPDLLDVEVDPSTLDDGGYVAELQISSPSFPTIIVPVVLTVGSGICDPLPCSELLVDLPYTLTFDADHGGVDADTASGGTGTGFTMILPSTFGVGYIPENLHVDLTAGELVITSTEGAMSRETNSQDNALGVGIDIPSQVTSIHTRIIDIPQLTGGLEQFGLWFGIDDRNVLRLFVNSSSQGDRIRFLMEVNDQPTGGSNDSPYMNLIGATVDLRLRVDPVTRVVSASYAINRGLEVPLGSHEPPPEFFSFDAAGINPEIGTRSFAGIFASHRDASESQAFVFDEFSVTEEPLLPPQSEIAFARSTFPQVVPMPTSMVVAPDGRLYVTQLTGTIHAFTLGPNQLPTAQQVIHALTERYGPRLTLGITVGPNSTSSNVDLWVCHSGPDPDAGEINSGIISRLSGPGFATVESVIIGLPRAFANHAPNSLHFGPDGRLYITVGGNTGAGAPNTSASEFGTRMEQYLSAALIAADVYGAAWPIDCFDNLLNDNPLNQPSVPPCALGANPIVEVYSSGLRNLYDFAFHPNGYIYGPDNGLGVTGTYPPTPFVPCFGPASVSANNPGEQPDILLLLEPGMYYGHPNPSRDECVYKNGILQGVPPLPNYRDPILVLGEHKSANGIVVYGSSSSFCGALAGDLLMTNYSVGDDLVRVRLSADGRSTLGPPVRVLGGFDDPLPIAQSANGAVFIGEFGGNRISVLVPTDTGCWAFGPSMPQSLLDSSGAALDGLFWVVAGKTGGGPVNSLYSYDPVFGAWAQGPDRPGAAVENPAVAAHGGKLYVFGGSTLPFSGMVATAQSFDPATGNWAPLPPMPTPRGGTTAQVIGGLIYVVGGLGADGASVATVEVFDPVANAWSTAPSLLQARDNAGSAAIDGRLYVFGGRLRNANGSTPNGTLDSTEMFDPAFGSWSTRAPMPTGRRTFASVTLNGRALALGGEATTAGGAFPQNEEYDPVLDTWRTLAPLPTPRHGCAGAVIDGQVYIAGGGIVAGSSFSNILEIFSFSGQD